MVVRNAIFCAFAAALPLFADTNITEQVKLTEDADWTSLGTVNIAADAGIHLNGRNLTVSGFTGSGSIYSSTLPPGYAVLEYVEATGAQYIDTGVSSRTDNSGSVKVVADISYEGGDAITYTPLLGASNPNSNVVGLWISPSSSKNYWTICNNDSWLTGGLVVSGRRQSIVATWKTKYQNISTNGVANVLNQANTKANTVSYSMYLPARNNGGTPREKGKFKMYSVKIYRPDTTLVRDYVPAKRLSDNAVGFYDKVSKTFFASATETAFVEGPEVERSGGELRINVASGTFQNSTVAISNSVKVVKFGAGLYTSSKTQTYTGGTVVNGGNVDSTVSHGFGAAGTAFSISNARVDIRGRSDTLKDYDVTIADAGVAEVIQGAAKISGGGGYQKSFLKSLTLSGDASIGVWQEDAFGLTHNTGNIQPFTLTLNSHTLTIQGNSRLCANQVTVADTGTINVRRVAGTSLTQFYPRGVFNAPLVTLDIGANTKMNGDDGFVVSNLVFSGTGGSKSTTVLGRYTPKVTSSLPTVVLGDETHLVPTLDIGSVSAAISGVSFVRDSTITVDVGSRTVNVGNKLVSWSSDSAPDISVSFLLTGDGWTAAEREIALAARGDGLYVKTTVEPAYATLDVANDEWQFYAADGTPYPDEWTGGVTSDMQVRFSSYEEYTALKTKNVSPSMFVMTGFTMPEGLGEVDATVGMVYQFNDGLVIDVKGNSLKLPSSMMFGDKAFSVTSSVAGGEVVIDVPSGTSRNTSMTLSGSLKVTKKGAGTFVSALSQTYTDGTDVEAGTVRPPDSPADNNYTYSGDTFTAFGTGPVNIYPGAAFDVRGNYAYTNVVLKGGTIANTLRSMGQTAKPGVFVASLADDDTSYFNMYFGGDASKYSTIYGKAGLATDLGGKTLEITVWNNLSIRSALTNGTLVANEKNGWFMFDAALDMRTTKFVCNGALQVNANLEIGEYENRGNTPYILGSSTMTVHRRFCPIASTYFYGCTLVDGCTFDLSQRETLFTTSCTNYQNKVYSVAYADNATIKVKLGERKVRNGTKIVGWTSKPTNNVKFVAAEGERKRSFAIKDDGLYVYSGLILIVK